MKVVAIDKTKKAYDEGGNHVIQLMDQSISESDGEYISNQNELRQYSLEKSIRLAEESLPLSATTDRNSAHHVINIQPKESNMVVKNVF